MTKTLPHSVICILAMFSMSGCNVTKINIVFTPVQKPVNILYDDDCDGDIDCAVTQPILHHWIDTGDLKVWGMVSSGPSQLGAPTLSVFRNYYGHRNLFTIGALTPSCSMRPSAAWNTAVVNRFDPGDTCANYPNCAVVLRQSIAQFAASGGSANGLTYVSTGPLSCEEEFRSSPPDAISPLNGLQMEQKYIQKFVLLNGLAPRGQEANCAEDALSCSRFFQDVTTQNGYPPVYAVPLNTGADHVITYVPVNQLPDSNPSAYAFRTSHRASSEVEDALAIEFAVFGNTGWTISLDSTDAADSATGFNQWASSVESGQYYLTTAINPSFFEMVLESPWLPDASGTTSSIHR